MKVFKYILIVAALCGSAAWGQDSLHVRTLGHVPMLSDWFHNFAIQASFAFVAEAEFGLRIIDFSNSGSPFVAGSYNDGSHIQAVAVVGNYAYVVNEMSLQVLNVSNVQNPFGVGSCLLDAGIPWNVSVAGNYAYVSDVLGGFSIVDVTNPASPATVGYWDGAWGTHDVKVVGTYAYVAHDEGGLRVVDVSVPSQPVQVGYCPAHVYYGIYRGIDSAVDVMGNYAYIADMWGLQVVDISNPQAPVEVFDLTAESQTFDVLTVDHYLFVADGWAGLRIMDITIPAIPVLVGYYDTPANAYRVGAQGCVACVDDSSSLRFYDVTYFIPCGPPSAPAGLAMQIPPRNNRVKLRWSPVTTDTTGAPIEVDRYVVYGTAHLDSMQWDSIGVPVPPDTTVFVDSTATGERGFYQVRAVVE